MILSRCQIFWLLSAPSFLGLGRDNQTETAGPTGRDFAPIFQHGLSVPLMGSGQTASGEETRMRRAGREMIKQAAFSAICPLVPRRVSPEQVANHPDLPQQGRAEW